MLRAGGGGALSFLPARLTESSFVKTTANGTWHSPSHVAQSTSIWVCADAQEWREKVSHGPREATCPGRGPRH
eukprot:358454-Chlamydomonas_euryale.AAC.3